MRSRVFFFGQASLGTANHVHALLITCSGPTISTHLYWSFVLSMFPIRQFASAYLLSQGPCVVTTEDLDLYIECARPGRHQIGCGWNLTFPAPSDNAIQRREDFVTLVFSITADEADSEHDHSGRKGKCKNQCSQQ